MSEKPTTAAEPEVVDENGDELIHVPKGQSRLRYLATIALVLFLLVIFVVADLFSQAMTGGGSQSDDVYLTWTDPVSGDAQEVGRTDFMDTRRKLDMLTAWGVYRPDSFQFADDDFDRSKAPDTTEEDTASFLIFEDMAADMGVAVSDVEQRELLRAIFGSDAGLANASTQARMPKAAIAELIRRLQRVQKLRGMMLGMLSIPDPNAVVADWAAANPEFKFQIVSIKTADVADTARAEVPSDEDLESWFHERPQFEQQKYYTEQQSAAEVAYLSIAPGEFDATALLEAYPAPDGVDLDGQANSYYSQFRVARFTVEVSKEDDGGETPEETPEKTPEESIEESDGIVPDETVETRVQEFAEVEEQVRLEAPIHAALGAFLTDMQDRMNAGEEVDFAAEAEALGLTVDATDEEGSTRQEYTDNEVWGNPSLASQLVFGNAGRFVPRVSVTDKVMALGRVTKRIDRQEKPFPEIRDEIAENWVKERSKEIALENLETVRGSLAARPEGVELADWKPEIEESAMRKLALEAGYKYIDRPWLARGSFPIGETFQTASKSNQFIMMTPGVYELEPGQVKAPAASNDGEEAFLLRFDSKRDKSSDEITYEQFTQLRRQTMFEGTQDFGKKVFRGDGAWLKERAKVSFPARAKSARAESAPAE